jgi:hypothetical protein
MNEMKDDGQGRRGRRLREAVDGPVIRRRYAYERTEDLARRMGLTVRQIENFVYRHNTERWARKSLSLLAKTNSENGRNGGRPRKKQQK